MRRRPLPAREPRLDRRDGRGQVGDRVNHQIRTRRRELRRRAGAQRIPRRGRQRGQFLRIQSGDVAGQRDADGPGAGRPALATGLETRIMTVQMPAMRAQGSIPLNLSPDGFRAYLEREIATWGAVIRAANIRLT